MTSYCTVEQVESEFKKIDFNTTSMITTAEVERFIEEISAYINAEVSSRYAVDITGTQALEVIRMICIQLVTCRVAKILNIKKALPVPDKRVVQEILDIDFCRMALQKLDDIKKGITPLDAPLASSTGNASSYVVENKATFESKFKRGVQQW